MIIGYLDPWGLSPFGAAETCAVLRTGAAEGGTPFFVRLGLKSLLLVWETLNPKPGWRAACKAGAASAASLRASLFCSTPCMKSGSSSHPKPMPSIRVHGPCRILHPKFESGRQAA